MYLETISIPQIFEEDIIDIVFEDGNVKFKYYSENNIIELNFCAVYQFNFIDFEYLNETDWNFGLCKYNKSNILNSLIERAKIQDGLNKAFGGDGEYKHMVHYVLVVDDVGKYDFLCKGMEIKI